MLVIESNYDKVLLKKYSYLKLNILFCLVNIYNHKNSRKLSIRIIIKIFQNNFKK